MREPPLGRYCRCSLKTNCKLRVLKSKGVKYTECRSRRRRHFLLCLLSSETYPILFLFLSGGSKLARSIYHLRSSLLIAKVLFASYSGLLHLSSFFELSLNQSATHKLRFWRGD